MEHYHIRVANDQLTFSAAHFLILDGAPSEPLHGHDYRVTAEVFAPLDRNQCVADFGVVQEVMATILSELDHRVLLPLANPALRVNTDKNQVEVTWTDRRWVFPRSECCLLEMPNTTTELLARWIAGRLVGGLAERLGATGSASTLGATGSASALQPQSVRVTVTEGRGWTASYAVDL